MKQSGFQFLLPWISASAALLFSSCYSTRPLTSMANDDSIRVAAQMKELVPGKQYHIQMKDGKGVELKVVQVGDDAIKGYPVDYFNAEYGALTSIPRKQIVDISSSQSYSNKEIESSERLHQRAAEKHYTNHANYGLYAGYGTFKVFYAGVQFPKKKANKFNLELGYQFALTSEANYSNIVNPALTNNAQGIRYSAGFQFGERNPEVLQLEFQDLQSNDFTYYASGSSMAAYSKFTEAYKKYGLKGQGGLQFSRTSPVYFMYSLGLYYMDVTRTYSMEGFANQKVPSDRVEYFHRPTVQVMIGIRVYFMTN